MSRIAIVSDSTCDLPADWSGHDRIHIVPVHILFGDISFREGVDIDQDTFYRRVLEQKEFPKTSQPNPEEFAQTYRRLAADHDAIISMHVTSKLSGTYQSAVMASEMVKDEVAVYPFDSMAGALGLGFMAMETCALQDAGASLETILARLEHIRQNIAIFLSPENLVFAQLSGRVSSLGYALASLLDIKPIVALKEGELHAGERVRTRTRAMQRMVELMHERVGSAPAQIGVAHAGAPQAAQALATVAAKVLNCEKVWTSSLATSVAVHLGPGTIGLVGYRL